jgi:hypothetical protein
MYRAGFKLILKKNAEATERLMILVTVGRRAETHLVEERKD